MRGASGIRGGSRLHIETHGVKELPTFMRRALVTGLVFANEGGPGDVQWRDEMGWCIVDGRCRADSCLTLKRSSSMEDAEALEFLYV